MVVKCEKCGKSMDKTFMTRLVRNNDEHFICRTHTQKMRRVHGGRTVPVRRAG